METRMPGNPDFGYPEFRIFGIIDFGESGFLGLRKLSTSTSGELASDVEFSYLDLFLKSMVI